VVVGEADGGERLRTCGGHAWRWTWLHDLPFPRGCGGEKEQRKGKGKKEEETCAAVDLAGGTRLSATWVQVKG
jgi:hypothetical protein